MCDRGHIVVHIFKLRAITVNYQTYIHTYNYVSHRSYIYKCGTPFLLNQFNADDHGGPFNIPLNIEFMAHHISATLLYCKLKRLKYASDFTFNSVSECTALNYEKWRVLFWLFFFILSLIL